MRVKLFEADSNDISLSTLKFRKIEIDDLLFFFFFLNNTHIPHPNLVFFTAIVTTQFYLILSRSDTNRLL